jgi:hypothetical protein
MSGHGAASAVLAGDEVAERRRFVPSPPCLPPAAVPPPAAQPLSALSDDRQRALLSQTATAIDRIHRYRVAHGSLNHDAIFADGETIWIAGVDAAWVDRDGRPSPRDRDLAWFRRECERFLGPSLQPGIGKTCRGMLAAWREPPPAPKPPKNGVHAPPPSRIVRKRRRIRRRIPWRWATLVAFVVSIIGGVAAWQLTPLPRYAIRAVNAGFRRLPEPVRGWLDPDGKFDSVNRRRRPTSVQDYWARLELQLNLQRPEAFTEVLTAEGDEYTELLRKFLQAAEPSFLNSLQARFKIPGKWMEKALPRLKQCLEDDLTPPAKRTVEYGVLLLAGEEELPQIKAILAGASHPGVFAEAFAALARLGRPEPIERLVEAHAAHGAAYTRRYLTTVLYYYPPEDAHQFLGAYSVSRARASTADAWQEVLDVVEAAVPARKASASEVFEKALLESLPRSLASEGPQADADLLMTLLCLWRLQTVPPEEVVQRFAAHTAQGAALRKRLSAVLIGDPNNLPAKVTLPHEWAMPDEWYAALLGSATFYPGPFVQDTLFRHFAPHSLTRQSRLLALADLRGEAERQALAADLASRLSIHADGWRSSQPLMISSVCTLLAAARNATADKALSDYLAPGPFGREMAAWEGLLDGAAVDPARHRALLQTAATHPLPSFWTRARELLALADGDVAAYRKPDQTRPAWPDELSSLVDRLDAAQTEADVYVILSRQRAGQLAEMSLGLTASPGAAAVLHTRMDRSESPLTTYLLLANQPGPLDDTRFYEFLHTEPTFQPFDISVMLAHTLRQDDRPLETIRVLAMGPRIGKNSPPLLHRATAAYAFGGLQAGKAKAKDVEELLQVIDRDPSLLVRHQAAAAALRCVKVEDKNLLLEFAAKRPTLPRGITDVLKLAEKL